MNITKHLPTRTETRTVAVKIPIDLKERVAERLAETGHSWNTLVIACLKAYLDESNES
jgi:ribosome maturation protein Sdo1